MTSINENNSNGTSMEELNERHLAVINNIKQLQVTEKYLFDSLPDYQEKGDNAVKQVVSQINNISTIRKNLFTQLGTLYSSQGGSGEGSTNNDLSNLSGKEALLKITEDELNRVKKLVQSGNGKNFNTLRMIEIGNYEFDRYQAHQLVFQIIAFISIIILILIGLLKLTPIPKNIIYVCILFVIVVGGIILARKIYDFSQRDNINYMEMDYSYMGDAPYDTTSSGPSLWNQMKGWFQGRTDNICQRISTETDIIKTDITKLSTDAKQDISDAKNKVKNEINNYK